MRRLCQIHAVPSFRLSRVQNRLLPLQQLTAEHEFELGNSATRMTSTFSWLAPRALRSIFSPATRITFLCGSGS
jgi:hypothetical protein